MPIHLDWKTNPADPSKSLGNRMQVGLELGGDDARIVDVPDPNARTSFPGMPGRVRIFEVSGGQSGRGSREAAQPRLIATFHGNFHRNASAKVDVRVTFELFGTRNNTSNNGEVNGFDPECLMGVDALVMTFVNREFVIFFPFLVDVDTEGENLEFAAAAEIGTLANSQEIFRSTHVLTIPIRRFHQVQTTTPVTPPQIYTGRVIGNVICHHEDYLVDSGRTKVPVAATGRPGGTGAHAPPSVAFRPYNNGDLRIAITRDMADGLMPPTSFLQRQFPGFSAADIQRLLTDTRAQIETEIARFLTQAFTTAGFAGMTVLFQGTPAAAQLFTQYTGVFQRSGGVWTPRAPGTFLAIPFWTFFAADGDFQPPQAVGLSEGSGVIPVAAGGQRLDLTGPLPIGGGNKQLGRPMQVRTSILSGILTSGNFPTLAAYQAGVRNMSGQCAAVIAHETGHALGMMHDILCNRIGDATPYSEQAAREILDLMASNADESPRDLGFGFSNQAKVIWQNVFSVTPNLDAPFLRNKTWGPTANPPGPAEEFRTVSFTDRFKRFFGLHGQAAIVKPDLTTRGTPPFAGSGGALQKGTFPP